MTRTIVVRVERELAVLIPRFLHNCSRDVQAIEASVAKNDLDSARKIGHSLKGVGGGYGFAEITRYGAEIESAARAGDGTAVACAAGALRTYLEALDVEYV